MSIFSLHGISEVFVMQTANTYCFLVYLLATNPDIQQRLYSEISTILGNHHHHQSKTAAAAACTGYSQFKYLNCVIKEALR